MKYSYEKTEPEPDQASRPSCLFLGKREQRNMLNDTTETQLAKSNCGGY